MNKDIKSNEELFEEFVKFAKEQFGYAVHKVAPDKAIVVGSFLSSEKVTQKKDVCANNEQICDTELNSDEVKEISKELVFNCDTESGKRIHLEYNTIEEFIKQIETDNCMNYTNVLALFCQNPFSVQEFNNIEELYNHCKLIIELKDKRTKDNS